MDCEAKAAAMQVTVDALKASIEALTTKTDDLVTEQVNYILRKSKWFY